MLFVFKLQGCYKAHVPALLSAVGDQRGKFPYKFAVLVPIAGRLIANHAKKTPLWDDVYGHFSKPRLAESKIASGSSTTPLGDFSSVCKLPTAIQFSYSF